MKYAWQNQQMDSSRTYVLLDDTTVVGYFSLSMGGVVKDEAPAGLVRGMPNYPVGMVKLTRLAVDLRYQHQHLGEDLLGEALRLAARAGEIAAARLVAVDAIDEEAARFYERYGFRPAPEASFRYHLRIKDIKRSLILSEVEDDSKRFVARPRRPE